MPTIYQQDYIWIDVNPGDGGAVALSAAQKELCAKAYRLGVAAELMVRVIDSESGMVLAQHPMAYFSANASTKVLTFKFGNLDTFTVDSLPAQGISLDKSTATITVGGTVKLTAILDPEDATSAVTWSTSAAGKATVSDGTVTGAGEGSATITATCNGKTATCAVTVEAAPAT